MGPPHNPAVRVLLRLAGVPLLLSLGLVPVGQGANSLRLMVLSLQREK